MSTRSLIGVLDENSRTFQARYCHSDGYPTYQVPALAAALHDHHDGDVGRLAEAILRYDWSIIDADQAVAEVADPSRRRPSRPDHVQPFPGVGYRYTDSDEKPATGALGEHIHGVSIGWLYLLGDDRLRVFHIENQRWTSFGEFSAIDLKAVDLADLVAREQAIYE